MKPKFNILDEGNLQWWQKKDKMTFNTLKKCIALVFTSIMG